MKILMKAFVIFGGSVLLTVIPLAVVLRDFRILFGGVVEIIVVFVFLLAFTFFLDLLEINFEDK